MINANGTYLLRDGKPFFWLGDTAWNAVLSASDEDFETYLRVRREQGFNVIQFVCTHWRAYDEQAAFSLDPLVINEAFFAARDRRVQLIREYGMVPAPVLLWALTARDPGSYLSEENAVTVARYIVERWGGDPVVWILGGDGHYEGEKAERWQRIGRRVFGTDGAVQACALQKKELVTMHPCGQSWVTAEFRREPWFGLHGYQSGHGGRDRELWWLLNGPPERPWEGEPRQPIINLEANYEDHPAYEGGHRFTDYHVRRASYWSLLVSPTAGVTYGNNCIWSWREEPAAPLDHPGIGVVEPWPAGLHMPGAEQMTLLKRCFEALPWWELRPAQELLAAQPGQDNPNRYQTVAATSDRSVVVAYLPVGGEVALQGLPEGLTARWFDPRIGEYLAAATFVAPDEQDWVLVLQG